MKLQRLGNYLYNINIPILPKIINLMIRFIYNSAIFSECQIGKGTVFAYGAIGVVIHRNSIIGENCVIGSNVTIGGNFNSKGTPIIGDNCFLATGTKILGSVRIGNNTIIGANSVVIHDIPDNCVAVGIPARVVKKNISIEDYK